MWLLLRVIVGKLLSILCYYLWGFSSLNKRICDQPTLLILFPYKSKYFVVSWQHRGCIPWKWNTAPSHPPEKSRKKKKTTHNVKKWRWLFSTRHKLQYLKLMETFVAYYQPPHSPFISCHLSNWCFNEDIKCPVTVCLCWPVVLKFRSMSVHIYTTNVVK